MKKRELLFWKHFKLKLINKISSANNISVKIRYILFNEGVFSFQLFTALLGIVPLPLFMMDCVFRSKKRNTENEGFG